MTPADPREVQALIAEAIVHEAALLRTPADLNAVAILRAICQQETNGGARAFATLHERAYCYGGAYYTPQTEGAAALRAQTQIWGCLAHQSFGPWQLLFITAFEAGYPGDPVGLRDPRVSAAYLVKILNRRVGDRIEAPVLADYFDAWNSGRARDRNVPEVYITEATKHYHAAMGDLEA